MNGLSRDGAANLIAAEMAQYRTSRRAQDDAAAWQALERAHILAQPFLAPHLASH